MGIENTLRVMDDLKTLIMDTLDLLKSGPPSLQSVGKILTLVRDIQVLIADAPGAFPELKDLDSAEVGQLSARSYDDFKDIIVGLTNIRQSK